MLEPLSSNIGFGIGLMDYAGSEQVGRLSNYGQQLNKPHSSLVPWKVNSNYLLI